MANESFQCTGCGTYVRKDSLFNGAVYYNGGTFCSQSCLERFLKKTSGGSSGGSGSSSGMSAAETAAVREQAASARAQASAARAQQAAAEAQRSAIEAAEEAAKKEDIRTRVSLIENTVFDTDDQTEFLQCFAAMCTEYKNCSDAWSKKNIKDAYKARLEKELQTLSISKPDLAA